MNRLRAFCVVAVVVGLGACGGAPSDAPADVDASGQNPQPTAVFSDDFETGEAEDWKTEGKEAEAEENEEVQTPPE